MPLFVYISLIKKKHTKEGAWSLCILVQNHNTQADTGSSSTTLRHCIVSSSSNVIDRRATKVPSTFLAKPTYLLLLLFSAQQNSFELKTIEL